MAHLSEKQRAHARRNALQDAPKHARTAQAVRASGKPCIWDAERIAAHTEYEASLIAPKREPARTEWKEQYAYSFTAYMLNTGIMKPDPLTLTDEEYAEIYGDIHEHRNEEPPAPKVQVTAHGPAYLLPGIEPAGQERGEATQTAMF